MVRMYANDPSNDPPRSFVHDIEVTRLDPRAKLPSRYDSTSIGLDVFAFLLTESGRATSRACHLKNVTEIPTGLRVRAPPGYFIQISSRISLARKGIFVANAPAMLAAEVDLTILLFNGSYETQYIAHEHRIAQLTLQPLIPTAILVRDIPPTEHPEDVHPGPRQGYC